MKNIFNSIKLLKPKANVFDLSHDVKLSANMGNLIPVCVLETIPGDKFNIGCESLLRFAPLVSPVMHRMDVSIHYFFVPNRIIWENWEEYIVNEGSHAFPTISVDEGTYTALHDYMGIPKPTDIPDYSDPETISALPFAAYQKIYNEYYRDQNLIADLDLHLTNGDNGGNFTKLCTLRKRAWEHDYFTAALPFAQKGDDVSIPLGDVALKDNWSSHTIGYQPHFKTNTGAVANGTVSQTTNTPTDISLSSSPGNKNAYDPAGTLEVNSTTINDLRRAYRLQEWLERNARGGTRYIENILAHFGVRSSDKRLNRPEYITGTKSPVVISEIVNTTGTVDAPQGNLAGHGVSVTSGKHGSYFCEEHGYIIGIMSIMPKTAYQQGIPRHFLKYTDPFQYYWPAFAHIGEQEVYRRELYAYQDPMDVNEVFGYVPRYSEYKFEQNRVAGDFRDDLDFWHLGRKFATKPVLNQTFVEADPTHRVFAVTDPTEQKLYCHIYNKIRAVRPMPKFGSPQL